MGRVSRMLKAISEKPKSAAPAGVEKAARRAGRDTGGNDPGDLARVIACWPRMPGHFKQAILTLVEVVEAAK